MNKLDEITRLREALEEFGRHAAECAVNRLVDQRTSKPIYPCDCGLQIALQGKGTCGTCDHFDRRYVNSLTSGTCMLMAKGNVRTETSYCEINSYARKKSK